MCAGGEGGSEGGERREMGGREVSLRKDFTKGGTEEGGREGKEEVSEVMEGEERGRVGGEGIEGRRSRELERVD